MKTKNGLNESKRIKVLVPEFKDVFRIYYPALCFFAHRLVNDSAIAQEIVLDVFVKLSQKKESFETLYSVETFLYVSTGNACINHPHNVTDQYKQKSNGNKTGEMNLIIHTDVVRRFYNIMKSSRRNI